MSVQVLLIKPIFLHQDFFLCWGLELTLLEHGLQSGRLSLLRVSVSKIRVQLLQSLLVVGVLLQSVLLGE